MNDKQVIPRWIRIYPEGQKRIEKEWREAYSSEKKPCDGYRYFFDVIDFQEACRRTSYSQTWRTRLARFLLWIVEKIEGSSPKQ